MKINKSNSRRVKRGNGWMPLNKLNFVPFAELKLKLKLKLNLIVAYTNYQILEEILGNN